MAAGIGVMLTQLLALVRLRLTLLQRTWFRGSTGAVAAALAGIMGVGLVFGGLLVGIGLLALGWQGLADEHPVAAFAIMDGLVLTLLVLWSVGLLTEVQRVEAVDFRRMLYLPVSLRMVFVLNFAVSLVSPMLVFFAFGAAGLAVGQALRLGPHMLLALALAAAFYFMLAAWTYHVRGLLAILMENKRRRRLVVMLATMFFVVVTQLPNLFIQLVDRDHAASSAFQQASGSGDSPWSKMGALQARLTFYNAVAPPGWLPLGTYALETGRYGVAALCFAGMTGLGALGLAAGYWSTYRHYTGTTRRRLRASRAAASGAKRRPLTERDVPLAAGDTAAMIYASLVGALRHPTIRMQIIMPMVFGCIFLAPILLGYAPAETRAFGVPFVCYVVLLSAGMLLFNIFGADAEGFQALILLPTPRHKYLLGKNLGALPLLALPFVVFWTLSVVAVRPPVSLLATLAIQFVQAYFSLCLVGNLMSIYFPYRLGRDAMKGAGFKPAAFLSMVVGLIGIPVLLVPTAVSVSADMLGRDVLDWGRMPVGVALALGFLALTLLVYRVTLPMAGNVLLAREQRILVKLKQDKD